MSINYNKLFNPNLVEIKEDVSEVDSIMELEEVLFAISEIIINYRKKNNLTQKDLAEKLNKNQTMISKLESGDYNPTFKQIYNISRKLTNSSEMFIEILRNIEAKINNISTHKYTMEIKPEEYIKDYFFTKNKNNNVISMVYKGKIGGNMHYEECTSSISNAG